MLDLVPQDHNNSKKIYISVWTYTSPDGQVRPLAIKLKDKTLKIDKILDVRAKASRKLGGSGIRYLCRIEGKEYELYLDDKQWFMEAPEAFI